MKQAVIFDLDGTLWDSSEEVCKIWNGVFEHIPGLDVRVSRDDMSSFMGKTMHQIGALLFPQLEPEQADMLMHACGDAELEYFGSNGAVLYPGLLEALKILSEKYTLCVVSNCQEGYVPAFMQAHGLKSYFADYEEADRTGLSKGENICLVIERNNIDKAIYVGDTTGDRTAAEYAGLPFVYASYGFGSIGDAEYVIENLSELPDIAEKLLKI